MTALVAALAALAFVEAMCAIGAARPGTARRRLVALHDRANLLGRAPRLARSLGSLVERLDPRHATSPASVLVDLEAGAVAGALLGGLAGGPGGALLGALLPPASRIAWLRRHGTRREAWVRRDLPIVLDLVAMAIEGGLAIGAALDLAARRGPEGPLRRGLALAVAATAAGRSRPEALAELRRVLPYADVAAFASAVEQSDRLGGRLAPALRAQAAERRQARWYAAERRALLAPVRLLLPLAACILPATFVVLLVPLGLRLVAELVP